MEAASVHALDQHRVSARVHDRYGDRVACLPRLFGGVVHHLPRPDQGEALAVRDVHPGFLRVARNMETARRRFRATTYNPPYFPAFTRRVNENAFRRPIPR